MQGFLRKHHKVGTNSPAGGSAPRKGAGARRHGGTAARQARSGGSPSAPAPMRTAPADLRRCALKLQARRIPYACRGPLLRWPRRGPRALPSARRARYHKAYLTNT